ncbi:MAG: hypothetical protein FDZ69_14155, partial [Deltaproteobacteria bacterium]
MSSTITWPANYAYKCVDCHDPHGDTNYYMVREGISAPTATNDTQFGSDNYGTPLDTAAVVNITFTSLVGNAVGSYGTDQAANGICEVCHVDTVGVSYYRRGLAENNTHYTTSDCKTCHDHSGGFKASCNGCHGGGNQYWPTTYPTTANTTSLNDVGAHDLHIGWLTQKLFGQTISVMLADTANRDARQKLMCSYCHNPGGDGDHGVTANVPAEVFPSTLYAKRFQDAAADVNATYLAGSYTCQNVDCHAQYGTGGAGSDGIATVPSWYSASTHAINFTSTMSQMNCQVCHQNPIGASGYGSHNEHMTSPTTVNNSLMACTMCHDAAVNWTNATLPGTPPPIASHINATFNIGGSINMTYTGAFRNSWGTCNTNNCHRSDVSSNAAPVANYTWNTAIGAIGSCTECHNAPPATNKHVGHLGSNWLNGTDLNECYFCH